MDERAIGGLRHLGDRTNRCPIQVGPKGDHDALGNEGVARVGAVVLPAHASHHEGDLLAGRESAAGGDLVDDAHALNAKYARVGEVRVGQATARVGLRLIDTKGRDTHTQPPLLHLRNRELGDHHLIDLAGTIEPDDVHQCNASFHGN